MNYTFDKKYFCDTFKRLVEVPSPTGYYVKANPALVKMAEEIGYSVTFDNKNTAYITLDGQDNSKTVLVGAHMDTLGMIVRKIDSDGKIRVRQLGGVSYQSYEGETVTVHTRDGREYTGLFACQSHSVHVFDDARTLEREEKNMIVILDERVSSKEEVEAFGIRHGDIISVEPRCQFTEKGFIKSRYIDDKGAVACCFEVLKFFKENGIKPKYKTIFAFPYYEEIGLGGNYIPEEVSEFVAIDIGLIGPDYDGNEYAVSICAKDNGAVYDYELTTELVNLAEKLGLNYATDIYYRYGTDANQALRAGNNIRAAVFGMAVYCSHGMERTHLDGIENTAKLLAGYLLER